MLAINRYQQNISLVITRLFLKTKDKRRIEGILLI